MSKTFCQVINYFTWRTDIFPSLVYLPAVPFFWNIHIFISRKERIDSINYLIKISIFLVFIIFLNLPFRRSAGDLIDQVDRERGANRNQSRGIQFIHAKRLTHHPNTRYTLLVMDSWWRRVINEVISGWGRVVVNEGNVGIMWASDNTWR